MAEHALELEGHVFVAVLPCVACVRCGRRRWAPAPLRRFRMQVALALLASGARTGSLLRFARQAVDVTAEEIAACLGIDAAELARWERYPIVYRSALEITGAIVRAALDGVPLQQHIGTFVLGHPRPMEHLVRIDWLTPGAS
jgi:hypothetical protein